MTNSPDNFYPLENTIKQKVSLFISFSTNLEKKTLIIIIKQGKVARTHKTPSRVHASKCAVIKIEPLYAYR